MPVVLVNRCQDLSANKMDNTQDSTGFRYCCDRNSIRLLADVQDRAYATDTTLTIGHDTVHSKTSRTSCEIHSLHIDAWYYAPRIYAYAVRSTVFGAVNSDELWPDRRVICLLISRKGAAVTVAVPSSRDGLRGGHSFKWPQCHRVTVEYYRGRVELAPNACSDRPSSDT